MDPASRIETSLTTAIARATAGNCPPLLAAALRHAVFPRGSRIRPRLCLAVADACGAADLEPSIAAASAIELLHSASLVHDDLPCFDDADLRRGRPSVFAAFGEPIAVLAGDGLIVLAFETLARGTVAAPALLPALLLTIGQATGAPFGITAGQAWELEPEVELSAYHRAKTGSLFVAAVVTGAIAAGGQVDAWRGFGERLGEAYQVADDIRDAVADPIALGKPAHQDEKLGRPNAVRLHGLDGAIGLAQELVAAAVAAVPPCVRDFDLKQLVAAEAARLLPKNLISRAA